MVAVRRLTTFFCLLALATALSAQTTAAQDAQARRTTEPVSADTDRDITDPNALRLTLNEALAMLN